MTGTFLSWGGGDSESGRLHFHLGEAVFPPARTGAVWQDGRTCRADCDALWISKRNDPLSDKCSESSYIWET